MDLIFILLFLVGGIAFIVLEIVAIPGTTVVGLSGFAMMIFGIYKIFDEYGTTMGIITLFICLLVCAIILVYALRAKTWKRFTLNKTIDGKANEIETQKFNIGDKGITVTRLAQVGKVEINGEIIEAYTTTDFIEPKKDIVIERMEDNKIFVKLA